MLGLGPRFVGCGGFRWGEKQNFLSKGFQPGALPKKIGHFASTVWGGGALTEGGGQHTHPHVPLCRTLPTRGFVHKFYVKFV